MRFSIILPCFLPLTLLAEVNSCNGVYTNRPCDQVVPTAPPQLATEQLKPTELSQRKSLLHELTMKSLRYRRKHSVSLDISAAGNTCLAPSANLDHCRKIVQELDDRLEQRKTQALTNQAHEQEIERAKTPPPTIASSTQKTVVIINQRINPPPRATPLVSQEILTLPQAPNRR